MGMGCASVMRENELMFPWRSSLVDRFIGSVFFIIDFAIDFIGSYA